MIEVAIAELYKNGTMRRHIRKVVKLYQERRDFFCSLLKERIGQRVSFNVPSGGMAIWAKFAGVDFNQLTQVAFRKGLTIDNQILFDARVRRSNYARLGFASLDLGEQERAIGILEDSLRAQI